MYKHCLFSLVLLSVFSFNNEAFAYLDPGTGSMLLQLLLGGVAGVLVIGKLYWQRVKDVFSGSRRAEPRPGDDINQSGRGSH